MKISYYIISGILAVVLVSGCASRTVVVQRPGPPPPRVETYGPPPRPHAVWVPGHWEWRPRARTYVWIEGHWSGP